MPFTAGYSIPVSGSVGGTNYSTVMGNGNYQVGNLSGKILVTGDAVLHVTSSFNVTGNDYILLAPNASLKVYVSAPSASIGGNAVINPTGYAVNFQYYGLPSNTSVTFQGNGTYVGTLYAPQAGFQLNGGGNDVFDFTGASVTKTVKMNGKFKFHYDEALDRIGPLRDYVITAWNEL